MTNSFELQNMTDSNLLKSTREAALTEKKSTLQVLRFLAEIEHRRLHLKRGYDSLFTFAVEFLGYSKASAYRRIKSMQLLRERPEIEDKIISGRLNLEKTAAIQVFKQKYKKTFHNVLPQSQEVALISKVEKAQGRESCALEMARFAKDVSKAALDPTETAQCSSWWQSTPVKTVIQSRADEGQRVHVNLSSKTVKKLEKLKSLLGSSLQDASSFEELLEKAIDLGLEAAEKKKGVNKKTTSQRCAKPSQKVSLLKQPRTGSARNQRYIPRDVKAQVWQRDRGQCTFKSTDSGKLCGSTQFLNFDHVHPFALGGRSDDPQNIRLLCQAHNADRAKRTFGKPPK